MIPSYLILSMKIEPFNPTRKVYESTPIVGGQDGSLDGIGTQFRVSFSDTDKSIDVYFVKLLIDPTWP